MTSHANMSKAALADQEHIQATGKCPDCGLPMRGHPKCEACDALTGPGHGNDLRSYHGHEICGHCFVDWRNLNRRSRRAISWERFLKPSPN